MEKSKQMLVELRRVKGVAEDDHHRFLELCEQEAVPKATLYVPSEQCEGWYEMFRIYVFSARPDIRDFVWCYSPRSGLLVCDANGKAVPLKEWDPAADLFFDESLSEGGTNMSPHEREKLERAR